MIQKKCGNIMCNEMIPRGKQPPYCEEHQQQQAKIYDNKRDPRLMRFYKGRAWQRFRATVLAEHHYLCSECGDTANTVHHIIEVKDDWNKRFKRSNVTPVCESCHSKIHDRFS